MKKMISLIAAICILVMSASGAFAAEDQQQNVSALIQMQLPVRAVMDQRITAYGNVTTDVSHTRNVSAPVSGLIGTMHVSIGQAIGRGDPLLEFVVDPTAHSTYLQAVAALSAARSELARTESQAALQLATQSQVAAARKAVSDAQASYDAQLRLGANKESKILHAPFDGVVVALGANQGDRVQAGATLLKLAHTNALLVPLGIDPEDAPKVKAGMLVHLQSVFAPGLSADGKIVQRQSAINPQTHLIDAMVRFHALAGQQWEIGTRAQGEIVLGSDKEWVVPRQSVLHDEQGAYIFQVRNGKAHRVAVTTGGESNGTIAIRGSFDPHLPVVVLGNYELEDGMAVREEAR